MKAQSFAEVLPGIFFWQSYSPEHKVDFTAHAILLGQELVCFDPVPLADKAFAKLSALGKPAAIVVTNANHERACQEWQQQWGVSIWATKESGLSIKGLKFFAPDAVTWKGFELHQLPGGSPGELSFRVGSQSLVLLGDAIVNLPDHPLQLLSERYCESREALKKSLADLVLVPFERLLMAHGRPILHGASKKVTELLA